MHDHLDPFATQMQITCRDVSPETLYDVLHDTHYRKKWDSNMIETYDIGRLTVNADVGYYSCEQPLHLVHRRGLLIAPYYFSRESTCVCAYSCTHTLLKNHLHVRLGYMYLEKFLAIIIKALLPQQFVAPKILQQVFSQQKTPFYNQPLIVTSV